MLAFSILSLSAVVVAGLTFSETEKLHLSS